MKVEFNLKQRLESPEVKRFEQRLSEEYGRNMRLGDVPLKNFVDVSSDLLETKVASLFLKGASDAAGFWRDLINVIPMNAPVQPVPLVSERDIEVRKGKISRAQREQSGGRVRTTKLDTTNDDKIRYIYLPIENEDIRMYGVDYAERMIVAAGRRFSKTILTDILKQYVNKAGNSQALGTDKRFVAVMKALGLNGDDGFGCSVIIIEQSTDFVKAVTEETSGGTMPWLTNVAMGSAPLGDNFAKGIASAGIAGYMFGQIPVYVINNAPELKGNILCVDVPAAAALGFAPGGEIRTEQEIKRIDDLIENAISAKYDIANPDDDGSGNTNAVAKVTGASA